MSCTGFVERPHVFVMRISLVRNQNSVFASLLWINLIIKPVGFIRNSFTLTNNKLILQLGRSDEIIRRGKLKFDNYLNWKTISFVNNFNFVKCLDFIATLRLTFIT